jgi:two-component system, LytTR family, sensor kinase
MDLHRITSVFIPRNRFESHALAWTVFVFGNAVLFSIGQSENRFTEFLADYILSLPLIFLLAYTTAYSLIPRYLLKGRILMFTMLFLLVLLFSGILEHMKTQMILLPLIHPETEHLFVLDFYSLSRASFFILIPSIYFISIKYARDWYRMRVLKKEEESKQLRNELKLLKSQVHPYFLLVTLGNLEQIAIKDPVKAAPGIEMISEMLSFILYECNFPEIDLDRETVQIRRFISLQELNPVDRPSINFKVTGPVATVRVAPLMIFTLVEFFFKVQQVKGDSLPETEFDLEVKDNILKFCVSSTHTGISESAFRQDTGIINLSKRMEILYGKKAHLHFRNDKTKTEVKLKIDLG